MFEEKFWIIIICGFMTYKKWHNFDFLVCHKSINNDYIELFLEYKLKTDMYYWTQVWQNTYPYH